MWFCDTTCLKEFISDEQDWLDGLEVFCNAVEVSKEY
jgi:hypothetical protein